MSRRGNERNTSCAIAETDSADETSACTANAALPSSCASAAALSRSRSAIATAAPSCTKRLTIPAPKPEAPPVTSAQRPPRRAASASAMMRNHRLERGERVQRRHAFLAAVAGAADAAERQLDPAAGAVIVEEHLTRLEPLRDAQEPRTIARPHARHQAVGRSVRDAHRLILTVERNDHHDGPEDLLLREPMGGRHVREQGGSEVIAARRRIACDLAARRKRELAPAELDVLLDPLALLPGYERPERRIRHRRTRDEAFESFGEPRNGRWIETALDQNARARGTRLARILHAGADQEWQRALEVGVVEQDLRRLAAELERHGHCMRRGGRLHASADPERAREREMLDIGMRGQRLSGARARARDHIQ